MLQYVSYLFLSIDNPSEKVLSTSQNDTGWTVIGSPQKKNNNCILRDKDRVTVDKNSLQPAD